MILRLNITDTSNAITILGKSFANISADLKSGQGLFYSIFGGTSYSKNDVKHLQNYISLLRQGVPWNQAWNQEMSNTSVLMRDNAKPIQQNITALEGLTSAQGAATFGAKALSLGMAALQAAMNVVVIMAVIKGIQLLVKAIDNYIHRVDIAKDKSKEFNEEIDDKRNTYKSHAQLVDDVSESYDKLAAKVDTNTNYNLGLDEDEYGKFIDLNNRLAEAFPTLVKGTDEAGNAIIIEFTTENPLQTYKKSFRYTKIHSKYSRFPGNHKYLLPNSDTLRQLKKRRKF